VGLASRGSRPRVRCVRPQLRQARRLREAAEVQTLAGVAALVVCPGLAARLTSLTLTELPFAPSAFDAIAELTGGQGTVGCRVWRFVFCA
jgi:hypothetical protein